MESIELDRAIELVASEDGIRRINVRIEQLNAELANLRRIQRALGAAPRREKKQRKIPVSEELESKIIEAVNAGLRTPKSIAEEIGTTYITVGRTVAASEKLCKNGTDVELVEADL